MLTTPPLSFPLYLSSVYIKLHSRLLGYDVVLELHRWLSGKESICQCRRHKRHRFDPWVGKIPQRRKWQPAPVFLPGNLHGQRSLVGYHPWGCKGSDITERLNTHIWLILTNQFYRGVIQQLSDYYFMTACQSLARALVRSTELTDAALCSGYNDRFNKYICYT